MAVGSSVVRDYSLRQWCLETPLVVCGHGLHCSSILSSSDYFPTSISPPVQVLCNYHHYDHRCQIYKCEAGPWPLLPFCVTVRYLLMPSCGSMESDIGKCPEEPELEAEDVLPNINRTQAAERVEKCRFCPWWP